MWIRMGGGSSKQKITNALEYLKQTAGWRKEDSSFGGTSGTSISYTTDRTIFSGEYIGAGYSNFISNVIDVKKATKLIVSATPETSAGAMTVSIIIFNADTNTVIASYNRQTLTNQEIDITYTDNIYIRVDIGNTGLSYYMAGKMTVSKLMLE